MDILAYLSLLLVLSFLLVKAAELIKESFVEIARRLKISTFLIGFFVLAFAASLPEFSVAVTASINGVPELSVGNLLGSTFAVTALVIGLNAIKRKKLPFKGSFGVTQVFAAVILLSLQIFVLLDQDLNRTEGFFLVAAYVLFIIYIAKHLKLSLHLDSDSTIKVALVAKMLAKGLLGLAALVFLSQFTVDAAIHFARMLQISEAVVGVLVLAIGTNLPELTLLFRSKTVDESKLAIGNFIGGICINVPTMGMLGIFSAHAIPDFMALVPIMSFLALALIAFGILTWTNAEITRKEGYLLLSLYLVFLVTQLAIVASTATI